MGLRWHVDPLEQSQPSHALPPAKVLPMSYRSAWVFDFDGTLIDSMGAFGALAAALLAERYGVDPVLGLQQYRTTSGLPFVQQIAQLYPDDPRNPETVRLFETRKQEAFSCALPFPDTMDLLVSLKRRGAFLAISSNNFATLVEQRVAQLRLPIDLICGWNDRTGGKGRAHFDAIVRKSRITWDNLTFVGDSLHDALIAHACDVRFVGRLGTFSGSEFRATHPAVQTVSQLAELLA